MKSLLGKKALVTGGGRRLGREIVLALAREGCDLIIHYNLSRSGAEETTDEVRTLGAKSTLVHGDLSDPSAVKRIADETEAAFGSLDILVNSASTWPDPDKLVGTHTLSEETIEELDQSFAVNARAPFLLIKHLTPILERSTDGVIINLLDHCITDPFLSRSAHTISKFALLGVTELAAKSLRGRVRVYGLELGRILPPDGQNPPGGWLGGAAVGAEICKLTTGKESSEIIIKLSEQGGVREKGE